MEFFLFINFSLLAILGSLGLLFFKAPIHGALSFIVTLVSIAGLYLLLMAKTLFLVQIVVYAGAIMVLSVFVMMFFNIKSDTLLVKFKAKWLGLVILPILVFIVLCDALWQLPSDFALAPAEFGEIKAVGFHLFSNYSLSFEAVSLLLTAAFTGVIAILKGKNDV